MEQPQAELLVGLLLGVEAPPAVRRGGTSELRAGAATGLQATLHLKGARVDRMDEDGLFVVAFRCDDEAWDEVARTEVVKAGASGAFASESSDPRGGLHRGRPAAVARGRGRGRRPVAGPRGRRPAVRGAPLPAAL